MENDHHITILLDIKEQIGALGAQMHEASRTRERLEEGVRGLYGKINAVDGRTKAIETHHTEVIKPLVDDVAKLKLLTGKFAAIWGAGFAVIAWALVYFSSEIHAFFFPPRHP